MNNEEIARRFEQLSRLLAIRGDDFFRTRSYRNAAELIRDLHTPLREIYEHHGAKGLQELPGVGKAISGKIVDLIQRGTFDAWENLTTETPLTVLELLEIEGVNLKIAHELYTRFRVASGADLREFVEGGGLDLLDNLGERTRAKIERHVEN